MATNTVPAAVPGPPDPPAQTPAQAPVNDATGQAPKGFLAAMVAPVEPARPTFDLVPTNGAGEATAGPDGVLDRSAPGVSSASFRGATEDAAKANDPTGARAKKSIWKEFWLAAATRWAKGGGATNKRLDLAKARAQSKAHQVKENRTTTVAKSGGLPVRNTGGSGSGTSKGSDKSRSNSSGHNTNGAGRGGSGGGRGPAGGSGNNGSGGGSGAGRGPGGTGSGKDRGPSFKHPKGNHSGDTAGGSGGRGGRGNNGSSGTGSGSAGGKSSGSSWSTDGKDGQGLAPAAGGKAGGKPDAKGSGHGPEGKGAAGAAGAAGKAGPAGKDGTAGKADPGTHSKGPKDSTDAKGSSKKVNLTKDPKGPKDPKGQTSTKDAKPGSPDSNNTGTGKAPQQPAPQKTPLEKARETGHGDGTKARRVVDHVLAYKDGVVDGWGDEKDQNAKEHDRLDKAHDTHKPKSPNTGPQPVIVTEQEDDGVTTDVKPLTVKTIDANTLTLDTAGGVRGTVGRRELRNFKQYERKLDAKVTVLQKISDACTQLQKQAEDESKDCQQLAEQAKGVKGGEKLVGKLDKLAEAAKNQAVEAAELAKRAARAAEMCKVVLTNIQTRYAPLYKAVVDSDETKPAELRFYNDKGTYAPAA